jgi:hypothetical protein
MEVSSLAGKPADPSILIDISKLVSAYYIEQPDPSVPAQRVAFGTSAKGGADHRADRVLRSCRLGPLTPVLHANPLVVRESLPSGITLGHQ